jgi:cation:H+ antiporter
MTVLIAILLVVVGIALLGFGADVLVRGAVTIAKLARIPAAVIGLTIVSMGTSLPELTVSVSAALRGASDLGVGNVVGSNIFNIGVVLGLTAMLAPMRVHSSAVRLEWPFMFVASFQLLLLSRDGVLDRLEGMFFVVGLGLFTAYVVRIGRSELGAEEHADLRETVERRDAPKEMQSVGKALALVAAGVALLVIGGDVLLRGAIELARLAGMTERVIGLTIIAAGTGAPEAATSLMAARRGQGEIALGNVIGSNIFNVLGILGVTALVAPLSVSDAMVQSDFVWMLGLSFILFPFMRSGARIARMEGGVLVAAYGTYLTLLVLNG